MPRERATVRIEPWAAGDLPLLLRLLGDPAMTVHLGGPDTPERLAARHARYLRTADQDPVFRVVDAATGEAVGWVGYWQREWGGTTVFETGWAVLPEHQGRGIATSATRLVVDAARADGRHRFLHAFPSPANAPSNAVCRRLDFTLLGVVELEYPQGGLHPSHDWRLDLTLPFAVGPVSLADGRSLRHAVLRPHETLAELAAHEPDGDVFAVGALDASGRVVATGFVHPSSPPSGRSDGGTRDDAGHSGAAATWRIRGMATDPAVRGQGAGRAVLDALVGHALVAGADRIWCNARTPARSLYARAGFAVTSAEFALPDIGPHVVMERGRDGGGPP